METFWRDEYRNGDAELLVPNLRKEDRQYIKAVSGMRPMKALKQWFSRYDKAWTFMSLNKVAACVAIQGDALWLQTNSLIDGNAREVVRHVKDMVKEFPNRPLFCLIPKDDARVLMIARCAGFTVEDGLYENYRNSGIDHVLLWRLQ